jgi:uncharacterized membrane-anchored protein YhcB (DUF1043 family)
MNITAEVLMFLVGVIVGALVMLLTMRHSFSDQIELDLKSDEDGDEDIADWDSYKEDREVVKKLFKDIFKHKRQLEGGMIKISDTIVCETPERFDRIVSEARWEEYANDSVTWSHHLNCDQANLEVTLTVSKPIVYGTKGEAENNTEDQSQGYSEM